MPATLETLPAPKLKALIARLETKSSANCSALIAAGRGLEKGSDCRKRAETEGDKLSVEYVTVNDALSEARAEATARLRYQGNWRPIKRA
jgi:hypothetical protein